jgi:hypothetical protein
METNLIGRNDYPSAVWNRITTDKLKSGGEGEGVVQEMGAWW